MSNSKGRLHGVGTLTPGRQDFDQGGRQPGAVPFLDLIESWGYDPKQAEVLDAILEVNMSPFITFEDVRRSTFDFLVGQAMVRRVRREDLDARTAAAKKAKRKASAEVVYFIRGHERVKIGFTANLTNRLAAMSQAPDVVMATIPGGRQVERSLHQRFAHLRIGNSEWFRLEPDLEAYIAEVAA